MTPRHSRLAVLLVAAVALLASPAADQIQSGHESAPSERDGRVVLQSPWVDGFAIGSGVVDRREGSERPGTQRLVLLAVSSTLLALAAFSRRAVVLVRSVAFQLSLWSPLGARAPPFFRV